MDDLITRFGLREDLHQSPMHAMVMRSIGWSVAGKPGSRIYYRSFGPLKIAKLQRPKAIDLDWLKDFRTKQRILTTYIEPGLGQQLQVGWHVTPFAHSATSLIDLSPSLDTILRSFTQKTRYNINKTIKDNKLKISVGSAHSQDFFDLYNNWNRVKRNVGHTDKIITSVLNTYQNNSTLWLAHSEDKLVASLLILYHDHVATYYTACATREGHKLFAPTLLTWTAMQSAKKNGCDIWDFGGIYDPRYPKMYKNWLGFTKFKSGFNPTAIQYPETRLQLFW